MNNLLWKLTSGLHFPSWYTDMRVKGLVSPRGSAESEAGFSSGGSSTIKFNFPRPRRGAGASLLLQWSSRLSSIWSRCFLLIVFTTYGGLLSPMIIFVTTKNTTTLAQWCPIPGAQSINPGAHNSYEYCHLVSLLYYVQGTSIPYDYFANS